MDWQEYDWQKKSRRAFVLKLLKHIQRSEFISISNVEKLLSTLDITGLREWDIAKEYYSYQEEGGLITAGVPVELFRKIELFPKAFAIAVICEPNSELKCCEPGNEFMLYDMWYEN